MTQTSSREYAIALFILAKESNIEEEISQGLKLLKDVFERTPEYIAFLTSPTIPKQQRLDTIKNTFNKDVPKYVMSFLMLLCEHGNISILFECIETYEKLYAESLKVSHAVVKSVIELTDDEKEKLHIKLEKLSKNTVKMHYKIDNTLLGGVLVEMDGVCLDGSLNRRLENIKEVMDQ